MTYDCWHFSLGLDGIVYRTGTGNARPYRYVLASFADEHTTDEHSIHEHSIDEHTTNEHVIGKHAIRGRGGHCPS